MIARMTAGLEQNRPPLIDAFRRREAIYWILGPMCVAGWDVTTRLVPAPPECGVTYGHDLFAEFVGRPEKASVTAGRVRFSYDPKRSQGLSYDWGATGLYRYDELEPADWIDVVNLVTSNARTSVVPKLLREWRADAQTRTPGTPRDDEPVGAIMRNLADPMNVFLTAIATGWNGSLTHQESCEQLAIRFTGRRPVGSVSACPADIELRWVVTNEVCELDSAKNHFGYVGDPTPAAVARSTMERFADTRVVQ